MNGFGYANDPSGNRKFVVGVFLYLDWGLFGWINGFEVFQSILSLWFYECKRVDFRIGWVCHENWVFHKSLIYGNIRMFRCEFEKYVNYISGR